MANQLKAQAKQRLQKALHGIPVLKTERRRTSSQQFEKWWRDTEIAIVATFGDKGRHVKDFRESRYPIRIYTRISSEQELQNNYLNMLDSLAMVLQSMIDEVEEYWSCEDLTQKSSRFSLSNSEIKRTSGKAFVAMWLDEKMDDAYEHGIEAALLILGYQPVRVDKVLSTDDIVAEILTQIKECDLMIADFTHGESGPRGGVYYEAGYAEALGKIVIMTCRADQSPDIHFDTNHKYHIMWESPTQLREALRERIPARLAAR